MTTLHLSDSLLDGYVAMFRRLESNDQTILLDKLTSAEKKMSVPEKNRQFCFEKVADPGGIEAARQVFGAWGNEANREDIDLMVQAIAENRAWDPEVEI